jgi:hypothetical protein
MLITPIPFDIDAADHLALLGTLTYPQGREVGYWKYDMLIAACAATCDAEVLISLDSDYKNSPMAAVLGTLPVRTPEYYEEAQTRFSGV